MISGPGVVSPSARPSIICAARQPVVVLDRALEDVGQHRIGAAEGQQRGLGEEPAPSACSTPSSPQTQRRARRWPRAHSARHDDQRRARARASVKSACGGVGVSSSISAGAVAGCAAPCPPPVANFAGREAAADDSRRRRRRATMSGNGTSNAKMATNAATAMRPQPARCFSAREPMRQAANSTIAVTAGLMP